MGGPLHRAQKVSAVSTAEGGAGGTEASAGLRALSTCTVVSHRMQSLVITELCGLMLNGPGDMNGNRQVCKWDMPKMVRSHEA